MIQGCCRAKRNVFGLLWKAESHSGFIGGAIDQCQMISRKWIQHEATKSTKTHEVDAGAQDARDSVACCRARRNVFELYREGGVSQRFHERRDALAPSPLILFVRPSCVWCLRGVPIQTNAR
jgi:hypothetical protein